MARRETFEEVLAAFAKARAERIEEARTGKDPFPHITAGAAGYIAKGYDRDDAETELSGTDLDTGFPT